MGSEEVAAAGGLVEELRAAQVTIAGQKRLIEQLRADVAFWWWIVGDLDENGTLMGSDNASTRAREALSAGHPGAELLAELEQQRDVIKRQVAQSAADHQALTELRGALATAQAELDRSQPIVIAAARLASGPDSEAWQALYAALEKGKSDGNCTGSDLGTGQ